MSIPYFALVRCRGHHTIHVDDRFVQKTFGLLLPNADADFVDRVHEGMQVDLVESATEVTGCVWIVGTFRARRVQVDFVIAAKLDVLQAGPPQRALYEVSSTWSDSWYGW